MMLRVHLTYMNTYDRDERRVGGPASGRVDENGTDGAGTTRLPSRRCFARAY